MFVKHSTKYFFFLNYNLMTHTKVKPFVLKLKLKNFSNNGIKIYLYVFLPYMLIKNYSVLLKSRFSQKANYISIASLSFCLLMVIHEVKCLS